MGFKIDGRGGHNLNVPGASKIVNEVTENRKIMKDLTYYLNKDSFFDFQNTTIDYTSSSKADLEHCVSKANQRNVKLFFSIHLNDTKESVIAGAVGTEVLFHQQSKNRLGEKTAINVCSELSKLGFKNRGAKTSYQISNLYELKYTKMDSIIIECFFCNSQTDVNLYRTLTSKKIAYAIYKALRISCNATSSIIPYEEGEEQRSCYNCKNYVSIK